MALTASTYKRPTGANRLVTGTALEIAASTKTLDEGDVGVWQIAKVDATVITLPATVAGYQFKIMNGATDGGALISVAPAAADKIMGNGFTSADNKAALNTKATAKQGDYIVLVGDGANGYMVADIKGTWARAA